MPRPVPFSLPTEIVDAARKQRESQAMSTITQNIDATLSAGFSSLQGVAQQAAEPLAHFAQSVAAGGISVPTLEDLTPDWMKREQQRAQQAVQGITSGTLGVQVPSLDDLTPPSMRRPAVALTGPGPAPQTAPPGGAPPAATGSGPPAAPGEIEAYLRHAAARRGIDPDVAVRVALSEGGLTDPVRQSDVVYQGQREQSYGPLQLNVQGGVGNAALRAGIDPRNPAQWRQALDFGLDEVARSGWGPWHGAARVGIGPREGIGSYRGPVPAPPSATPAAPGARPALAGITPPQFGLGDADAESICGPILAVAFAKAHGRNATIAEAKQMAAQYGGWTRAQGMGGPEAMATTLRQMGIPAHYAPGPLDLETIRRETQNGNPVGINTAGHYYVVEGVDPQGRLDLGNSAKALRASGGRQWFRPEEIAGLGMGAPTGVLYKDSPASPAPSVAVQVTQMPTVSQPAQAAPRAAPHPAAPPPAAPRPILFAPVAPPLAGREHRSSSDVVRDDGRREQPGISVPTLAQLHPNVSTAFVQANGREPTPEEAAELAQLGYGVA